MVRIAIAGGTGGLGRTLVDELSQGNDHEIFVLSRKVQYCSPAHDAICISQA